MKNAEIRLLLNSAVETAERAQTTWERDPLGAAQDARSAAESLLLVERELARRARRNRKTVTVDSEEGP